MSINHKFLGKGRKDFIKKITGSFGVKMAGMGFAFLLQVYLARVMGVDQYGLYIYVLTCLNLLLFICLWGWSSSTVKFVSVYNTKKDWQALKGILQASAGLPFFSSILVALILVITLWTIQEQLAASLVEVFLVGSVLLPFNALLSTLASATQGLKSVVLSQIPQAIYRPLLLVGIVAGFYSYWEEKLLAAEVMELNIVCAVIVTLIAWAQLKSKRPKQISEVKAIYHFSEWSSVALPMLLFSGFVLLMKQFDIIMLGYFSNPTEAGIYSVASRIADLSSFGLMAINMVVAPMIAEQYADQNIIQLQKTATLSAIAIFFITLPVTVISFVFGEQILGLFGSEFKAGYNSLMVLVCGQAFNALAGSVGFFMTMTGRHKQAAVIMGGGAIFNVIANLILIPRYGMVGAAYATAFSMVFWNLLMWVKVRKTIGIDTTVFSLLRN